MQARVRLSLRRTSLAMNARRGREQAGPRYGASQSSAFVEWKRAFAESEDYKLPW